MFSDRYRLERRIAHRDDLEHWIARDQTLDRAVGITVFAQSHPHCAAVLDGARRAAGVEDGRLVRVLDVGRYADLAFVVEESLTDAESLAALVRDGPLPAEETRRIVGETAAALESARTRGLHHLRLTPHAVLRVASGGIKVSGVAVAAALDGADDLPPAQASRIDAAAIVALAYTGLTGTWPLGDVTGVAPAPRTAQGVREPADAVRGVPADLNTLCRLALNDREGPRTPGEIATQVAPWSAEPVRAYALGVERPQRYRRAPGVGRGQVADHETTQALPVAAAAEGLITQETELAAQPLDPGQQPTARDGGGSWHGRGPSPATSDGRQEQHGAGYPDDRDRDPSDAEDGQDVSADTDGYDDGRYDDGPYDDGPYGGPYDDGQRLRDEDLEPPLPLLSNRAGNGEPDRAQAGLAIGLAAGLVVIALALAIWGVNKIGSHSPTATSTTTTSTSTTPSSTTTTSTSTTPSSTRSTTSTPAGPFAITGARVVGATKGYDHPQDAALVHDGNAATYWSSTGYARQDFNGLKKGMGVALDLGTTRPVSKVKLTLPGTSQLTVYVGDSATHVGRDAALGRVDGSQGTTSLKAHGKPVSGRYVVVWFTKALTAQGGFNKCQLAEVVVS